MKKLIIFDAMGVIYKTSDDVKNLLHPYLVSQGLSASYDDLKDQYIDLSLGKITPFTFFSKLGFAGKFPQIEKEYLDTCLELDEGFIPLAKTLNAKYKMAMLSNDVLTWSEFLRSKFDLDKYFMTSVISSEVGARKPSKEIYQALLEKTGYKACDCVFIDDSISNLKTAKSLGIDTIWFNRNNEICLYCGLQVSSMTELKIAIENLL